MIDVFPADDVATSNIPSRTTTLRIGLPPFLAMVITIAPFAVYGCDVEHIGSYGGPLAGHASTMRADTKR